MTEPRFSDPAGQWFVKNEGEVGSVSRLGERPAYDSETAAIFKPAYPKIQR